MDKVHSVEELLQRAAERGMPLEKMRFFINEDRHEPRCFGIYHDDEADRWIVYKNKADGSRAVRYSGPDEAYAAQEIWAKINSEIELRRDGAASAPKKKSAGASIREILSMTLIAILLAVGAGLLLLHLDKKPSRGYYRVKDDLFYYQNDSWYYFDEYADDWTIYVAPEEEDWYEDGAYYGEDYAFEDSRDDFSNSGYYVEPRNDSSSSDSSIFDSWDSSDTDWSSDW